MKTNRAFTLIELLVVIAIIALLLSIIVPSLRKAKEITRSVVCANNIRQLCIGMSLYAEQNGGKAMQFSEQWGKYWFHEIAPFLGDTHYKEDPQSGLDGVMKVAFCPRTKRPVEDKSTVSWAGTDRTSWKWNGGEGSYGMNMWFIDPQKFMKEGAYDLGLPLENFYPRYSTVSGSVPVFGDSVWVGSWPFDDNTVPEDLYGEKFKDGVPHVYDDFMARYCIDRHSMAINVGFAGGNVEKIKLEKLWTLKWHKNFRPNFDIEVPNRATDPDE